MAPPVAGAEPPVALGTPPLAFPALPPLPPGLLASSPQAGTNPSKPPVRSKARKGEDQPLSIEFIRERRGASRFNPSPKSELPSDFSRGRITS
jgi:hypothetical protein